MNTLKKLNKPQLIAMVLCRKPMLESLRDEVKEMNTNFMKLETDVCIIKTVNNLLMKTSVEIQRQCWGNSQYSRREC